MCSKAVSSRRILWKDADMDYEVLSDEEWEEEPEGEELDGSDGDDDPGMDEEEDTDGFMVAGKMSSPHLANASHGKQTATGKGPQWWSGSCMSHRTLLISCAILSFDVLVQPGAASLYMAAQLYICIC